MVIASIVLELPESNGYISVEANGGLNQQRISVGYILFFLCLLYNCFFGFT